MAELVPTHAPVHHGDDPAVLHREGLRRFQAGDVAGAIEALRAALARSVDPELLNDLGVACAAAGLPREAAGVLTACLLADPERTEARENLAALTAADPTPGPAAPAAPTETGGPVSQAVYLGDHTALARLPFGAKIYLDTRDLSLAPHLMLGSEWEPWTTELIRALLRPGSTFVDVGANVGYFTLLAGSIVGPTGHVVAFEPNPDLASLVARSLSVNGLHSFTRLIQAAAMSRPGQLEFKRFAGHQGSSGFYVTDELAARFHDRLERIVVDCTTLDEALADRGLRIDLIKIDAEGAEPEVIAGAERLLEEQRGMQVIMEYTPSNRPAVEALLDRGYRMCQLGHDHSLTPIEADHLDDSGRLEMLFFFRGLGGALQGAGASAALAE
jgi:FkbM family methyltransferase